MVVRSSGGGRGRCVGEIAGAMSRFAREVGGAVGRGVWEVRGVAGCGVREVVVFLEGCVAEVEAVLVILGVYLSVNWQKLTTKE